MANILTVLIFLLSYYCINFIKAQDSIFFQAQRKFSLELFSNVSGLEYSSNVILCPIIVDISLSMLLVGSSGLTFKQLLFGLQYPANYSINLVQSNSNLMLKNMAKAGGIEYGMKLYVDENLSLQSNFKTSVEKYFHSGVETVDSSQSEQTTQIINDFISSSTHGMIQNMFQTNDISKNLLMILINCIYFKGSWINPFNKNLTASNDFKVNKTNTIKIDFMRTQAHFKYGVIDALDGAKVIELPYVNSSLTLTLILPQEIDGLKSLIKAARIYDWTKLSNELSNKSVLVNIPKFNSTFAVNLNQAIKNMGMDSLFNNATKFDYITYKNGKPYQITLNSIFHKAVINIDEEGTTAAAVNAVIKKSVPGNFVANHPFLYALRTNYYIYFLGQFIGI